LTRIDTAKIETPNATELVASVIVPARNAGQDLGVLLGLLARQTIGRDR
jgi:hypothetical protein